MIPDPGLPLAAVTDGELDVLPPRVHQDQEVVVQQRLAVLLYMLIALVALVAVATALA